MFETQLEAIMLLKSEQREGVDGNLEVGVEVSESEVIVNQVSAGGVGSRMGLRVGVSEDILLFSSLFSFFFFCFVLFFCWREDF
jgi:hypothetical protein